MIKIIYGPNGSGKSHTIYQSMKEDAANGVKSYLIVPEQETVQCERLLLELLPPSAQLTSEVLNFSRLANLVFRKYGGLSYNYANTGAKTLIMWRNLKELAPLLHEYSAAADTCSPSFASEMLSAVDELKAYCVTPAKLDEVAEKLRENEYLKRRLSDLSLIAASYHNFFSESYSDVSDDLTKLSKLLNENKDFLKGKNVYIDSFTSFTKQEYDVIKEIFESAANVTVSLPMDGIESEQIHYESSTNTALRLSDIAKDKIEFKKISKEFPRADALSAIADRFWAPAPTPFDKDFSNIINVIKCSSPYEEAQAAASIVVKLMKSGTRCRDIAIIARDASLYKGIIDVALENAGIPYFISQNSDIMSKPPVKFLLSALRIKLFNWRAEDIISYLKAGICAVDNRDVDLLECYLSVWNIRGNTFTNGPFTMNPDGYTGKLTERGKEILRRINLCRDSFVPPLIRLFTRIDESKNATEMCRALYLFMEEQKLSEILSKKADKDYRQRKRREASELLQIYNSVVAALESISNAIGDCELSTSDFYDALKIMLDSISVGAIPTGEDQVIVGSASMLRTSAIKCAVLIGMNEGEFPQTVKETGFFSDNDKRLLEPYGISLSANTSTQSSDELFYAYRAMSAPSEKLFLLYHESDFSGKGSAPSLVISRLNKLFENIEHVPYSSFPILDKLVSEESAMELFGHLKNTPEGVALSKYFDSIETYRAKKTFSEIPICNLTCRIAAETVDEVHGDSIRLTQTVIDDYSSCPFEYMCCSLITLEDITPASFDYANFGSYIHYVFENYLKTALDDGMIGKLPDPTYISETVNDIADEYLQKYFPDGEAQAPRLNARFKRMRRLAVLVATGITREFASSNFRPMFFELPIGKPGNGFSISPVTFNSENGKSAYLVGKVDRVDILRRDDSIYVRVVDYKSGNKTFSQAEMEQGKNLQLPLYLFALCNDEQYGFKDALGVSSGQKIIPAGATYLSSLITPIEIIDVEYDKNKVIEQAENAIMRSGFLTNNIDILRDMSFELDEKYLCGAKLDRNGTPIGSSLLTHEGMDGLKKKLDEVVIKVADSMSAGIMDPNPSVTSNNCACKNCRMQAICRAKKN